MVERDELLRLNADQLESALSRERGDLGAIADEEQRSRRADAIDQLLNYVALLRDAASAEPVSHSTAEGQSKPSPAYAFKLELEDGRWDVDEKKLTSAPRIGDVLSFDDGRRWRVRAAQLVRPRPAQKPAREFFVCAPLA